MRHFCKTVVAIGLLSCVAFNAYGNNDITPSHVYQQTEDIVSEISLLRKTLKITRWYRKPSTQTDKHPIHVYAKSLEVLEKIARAQKENGLTPLSLREIPLRDITPKQVFEQTKLILRELRKLKTHIGSNLAITPAKLAQDKTPSNVYQNMWLASYMMDAIAGEITPSDAFRNTRFILEELTLIAGKIGMADKVSQNTATVSSTKTLKTVHLEGFISLHLLSHLERDLGMVPIRVSSYPEDQIAPSNVYDVTNMIIAELSRIKLHLGITNITSKPVIEPGKKPEDVYINMRRINEVVERLGSTANFARQTL